MNNIDRQRALLVLDLDECLIFGSKVELQRHVDFTVGPYYIYRRPELAKFLQGVAPVYDLAVWSSATSYYVQEISIQICPEGVEWRFVWGRDRCTPRTDFEKQQTVYIKDLKKVKNLGYPLERVLMVDDTPDKLTRNYGNAVYVQPFEGEEDDRELAKLLQYLEMIRDESDFRKLEKRGWRHHFDTN